MFALVAGAALAEVTVGGMLQTNTLLLSGDNVKESDVNMGGKYGDGPYSNAKLTLKFGEGSADGRIVYDHLPSTQDNGRFWGWLAWRPNQLFRVKVGSDEDGEWGWGGIASGWGFTGEAKNSVAVNDYSQGGIAMKYNRNAYGGFNNAGGLALGMSVFLIDTLQINFYFNGMQNEMEISERFAKMHISASYGLEGIGTIRFAAVGAGGLAKHEDDGGKVKDGDAIGTLWFGFESNNALVEGLGFEVITNFDLPHVNASDTYGQMNLQGGINLTKTNPFNLKVRLGGRFGGKDAGVDNEATGFSVGVLPSYKLTNMTIFLHAGLGLETPKKDEETIYTWFVNPYIFVPVGGARFMIGMQIFDKHADREGMFTWSIPFGFYFYF